MRKDTKTVMVAKSPAARKSSSKAKSKTNQQGRLVELPAREVNSGIAAIVSATIPEYKFLQLNEGAYKPTDSAARKLIRSHVMRNYFQEKGTHSEDISLANSASTVNAKDKLKGRWRLGKQPLPIATKQVTEEKGGKQADSSQLGPRILSTLQQVQKSPLPPELLSHNTRTLPSQNDIIVSTAPHLEMFQASVRDPFDSMPVAASNPRTNRLMHFYQTEFNINVLAQNPSRTFYNYVVGHEGLLHGMLAIVALYMHGHRGMPVKADILYHRGKAMQLIHRDLSNPNTVNPIVLLGSMMTITVFENLCGNYYTARAHLTALRSLIKAAGGIQRFAENDSIPRAVAWAEYHYAGATRTVPAFRYSPSECGHPEPPIPEQLLFDAAKDYPYGLALINTYGHSIYNTFRRLHIMSIATSSEWEATLDMESEFRYALSNIMLDTEYDLLALAYQLKSDAISSSKSQVDLLDVCDCLCAAAQIFLYAGLRTMPLGTRTVDLYLSRLRFVLYSEGLVDMWGAHAHLESLLWTLAVTATSANGRAEYLPAMNQLRKVCDRLEIANMDEMLTRLRGFAWNDPFDELGRSVLKDLLQRASYPLDWRDDRNIFPQMNEMQPSVSRIYGSF